MECYSVDGNKMVENVLMENTTVRKLNILRSS